MRPLHLLVPLLPLALVGCHDSSGGASGGDGAAPALLTSHAVAALSVEGHGELWLARVYEPRQGADRNGDGDTDDVVPAVLDLADDSLTNLALAMSSYQPATTVGDDLIAFGVPESEQGNTDLNGDGDTADVVLHVYDSGTRTTTSTGLAFDFIGPAIGAGTVAFGVSEAAQGGTDLDGSGSASGNVLHVYDSHTGLTTNAQRNATWSPDFHDHAFAFTTDEPSVGADLNGDGDQSDTRILQMFDLVMGGIISVPLAITGNALGLRVDDWYALGNEAQQGVDLNGDLDLDDSVLLAVEPHLGTFQSTGTTDSSFPLGLSDGQRLAVIASEQDGIDRNGNGQFHDEYAALLQPGGGPTFVADVPLTFVSDQPVLFTPDGVAFLVSELEIGGDLNGNGHPADKLLHLMDATTGAVLQTDLGAASLDVAGAHVVIGRYESIGSIPQDWNGDGDSNDIVLAHLDTGTGALVNTGLTHGGLLLANASVLLVLCDEEAQGGDLNGDGDPLDSVWVRYELATGRTKPLAATTAQPGSAGLADDGSGVLLVKESDQGVAPGTDLNGDGDTLDFVLHRFRAPLPERVREHGKPASPPLVGPTVVGD